MLTTCIAVATMDSGSDQDGHSVSSKQWFLTYNEDHQELFIWRKGMRLKLKDGTSGGPVKEVDVNNVDQTLTVSWQ